MKKNSSIKALENKASKGDLEAIFQLGEHYSQGKFVEADTTLAQQYFDKFIDAFREPRLIMRIPVKSATQSTGMLPPKPVKAATLSERRDAGNIFLPYIVSGRQISLFFRSDSPSNLIL